MKINITTKTIALVFCSLIFATAIVAQEKPRASEFATVDYLGDEKNLPLVYDKLASFIEQLEQEPATTQGFIRIAQNGELAKKLMPLISANPKVADRIIFFGNLKYPQILEGSVGFYLIPIDAEIPYGSVHEPIECPKGKVEAPTKVAGQKSVLAFRATIKSSGKTDYIYEWSISAGKIIAGQGTSTIKVDTKDAKEITVAVSLGGEQENCEMLGAYTMKISGKPQLIESYGREIFDTTQGRLDNFIAVLTNNPTAQGYVINYTGRFENKRAFAKRIEQIKTHFKFRADYIDTSRLTFVNGGYRENIETELWLSFDDNQKPVPTPTVDKRFVQTPKPTKKPRPRR